MKRRDSVVRAGQQQQGASRAGLVLMKAADQLAMT